VDVKIFTENIEDVALQQVYRLASLPPFFDSKIRIMPDVHAGEGCVIGFTADLGEKVIPNIVGVDIGCGMRVIKFKSEDLDLEKLDSVIKELIPSGKSVRENGEYDLTPLHCYHELKNVEHLERSLGTLGGGNHFIEIDVDEQGFYYLIVHSGSRNLGKQVALLYQKRAVDYISGKHELPKVIHEKIQELKEAGQYLKINDEILRIKEEFRNKIPNMPNELCYLEGEDRMEYLDDMKFCQQFALENRIQICALICKTMKWELIESFDVIHNYISFVDNIVRKGAISARKGEKVLIPLNMRDGCILGIGKGNEDWNFSAPHGAGRIMSRSAAKEMISLEEFEESMKGIYSSSINNSTLDESPFVYKPAEEIVERIHDTVEITEILRPIYNFKASE
jgi:RNA-splicing ligase RtcB